MTPNEVRKLWVDALRSGEYKQGKSRLRIDDSYCCLGVLCDLAVKNGIVSPWYKEEPHHQVYVIGTGMGRRTIDLPDVVAKWVGMKTTNGHFTDKYDGYSTLTGLNDKLNQLKFDKIADLIEAEPNGMFVK